MEFRVLGPFAIECGGRTVRISSPRQRALAAFLLVHANRTVPADRILDELWDGGGPESGRDAVAFHVGRLRRALGACGDQAGGIRTRDGGYVLEVDPEAIDAARFERLAAEGRARLADDPAGAIARLSEALGLWRGEPYEGLADAPFVVSEARRLGELRLRATEDRFEAELAVGRHAEIVADLQSLVDREPLRERLRGLLMTALYRSGRQADALRVYGDARRVLAEELGIDPSPELQELQAAVLRQDPALLAGAPVAGVAVAVARRNPFKGLRPFGEADAGDFFGREALTARLVERLAEVARADRMLLVVGPSGCGKSSVVRAGLVPALRAGALDGSAAWLVGLMLPGSRPFDELAGALRSVAGEGGSGVSVPGARELMEEPAALVDAVKALVPADGRLVLVVDQLEELWILAREDDVAAAFIDTLATGLAAAAGRLLVVATLRVDHLEAALRSPALGPFVRAGTELVPPLERSELRRAIERPAARAGLTLEPGLADTMVGEAADRPSMLPLLQYALTELAERAEDSRVTRADNEAIGGVLGALAGRAEATYQSLEADSPDAARQVFLRLVAVEATGEPGVRRVPLVAFDASPDERSVVERFGRARLVAFGRDARTGEATVEVSHEALLARWPRLMAWVDGERDAMWMRRRLGDSALEWLEHDRDPGFLLTGGRLDLLAAWAATTDLHLSGNERALLDASVAERRRAADEDAARAAKERRLEQRGTRWLRALVAVFAIASIVSTGLLGYVWRQSETGAEQRAIASARELAVAADGRLESDPSLALLLAVESARVTADRGWITEETMEALHWAVQAAGVPYPGEDVATTVRDGPDGARGLYLLPAADLIRLARTAAGRSLTADECRTWLHVASCPSPIPGPSRPLAVMTEAGLRSMAQLATAGLAGTTVRVWSQLPIDVGSLSTDYAAASGVGLVTTTGDIAADPLAAVGQADVALLARPGDVVAMARQHRLLALSDVLRPDDIADIAAAPLAALGWIGDSGVGPTAAGARLAGVPLAAAASSLLWYPADAFKAAGYRPPTTWAELEALVARITADGRVPWCMGLQGGQADGASGEDWFEDFLIDRLGPSEPEAKTTWSASFTHPAVKDALLRFNALVSRNGAVLGGVGSALRTPAEWTAAQMGTAVEPTCWLIHASADERARWTGPYRSDLTPVRVPIGDASTAMRARVYTLVILRDRPEVRAFVRQLLAAPFASELAAAAPALGILPLGPTGTSAWPVPSTGSPAAQLAAALRAGDVWPDAADRMSRALGLVALPQAILTTAREDPGSAPDFVDVLQSNLAGLSAGSSP